MMEEPIEYSREEYLEKEFRRALKATDKFVITGVLCLLCSILYVVALVVLYGRQAFSRSLEFVSFTDCKSKECKILIIYAIVSIPLNVANIVYNFTSGLYVGNINAKLLPENPTIVQDKSNMSPAADILRTTQFLSGCLWVHLALTLLKGFTAFAFPNAQIVMGVANVILVFVIWAKQNKLQKQWSIEEN